MFLSKYNLQWLWHCHCRLMLWHNTQSLTSILIPCSSAHRHHTFISFSRLHPCTLLAHLSSPFKHSSSNAKLRCQHCKPYLPLHWHLPLVLVSIIIMSPQQVQLTCSHDVLLLSKNTHGRLIWYFFSAAVHLFTLAPISRPHFPGSA